MIDAHLFTKLIIAAYACNVINYACYDKWGNAFYWLCAAGITISATWFIEG